MLSRLLQGEQVVCNSEKENRGSSLLIWSMGIFLVVVQPSSQSLHPLLPRAGCYLEVLSQRTIHD